MRQKRYEYEPIRPTPRPVLNTVLQFPIRNHALLCLWTDGYPLKPNEESALRDSLDLALKMLAQEDRTEATFTGFDGIYGTAQPKEPSNG